MEKFRLELDQFLNTGINMKQSWVTIRFFNHSISSYLYNALQI